MPKPKGDEDKLRELLSQLASDSMKKGETPQQWVDRLRALQEVIDDEINATRVT